jgi:hypothetical protein
MKTIGVLFLGLLGGVLLAFAFLWTGSSRAAAALPLQDGATATPSLAYGSDEQLPASLPPEQFSLNALATPVPGETLVYFIPSDNDATGTVLYLYNTDPVLHTVALRGYGYNGTLVYSLNINVNANSFLRLASDSIAAAPPPSWATPAPLITNFTDFTYLASLSLPHGVKAEGYVVFNPGTGVVDPRVDQGAIPLRFSTDPETVFLPSVNSNP